MAISFVGYAGYLVERLGLISCNFMSTKGGVSNSIFAADITVSQGQCHLGLRYYHLGLIMLAIEASPGATLSHYCNFLLDYNKMAQLLVIPRLFMGVH